MPIGTTSYLFRSRALRTDSADLNDTSCSPDRPPKITPTRIFFIGEILPERPLRPFPRHCGPRRGASPSAPVRCRQELREHRASRAFVESRKKTIPRSSGEKSQYWLAPLPDST